MNIVWILGGLGNQMFQYAFFLSLKERCHAKVDLSFFYKYKLHNGYELNSVFGINTDHSSQFENAMYGVSSHIMLNRLLSHFVPNKRYVEKIYSNYDASIFQTCNAHQKYYQGYWQSWKYFSSISSIIRESFKFPDFQDEFNLRFLEIILKEKCFSIHVRRGDYINHSLHGNVCNEKYYKNAIKHIDDRFPNAIYLIFSNDIDWCKNQFQGEKFLFVDCNSGKDSFNDMHLMSLCAGNIIANSSFSWWGAYLTKGNYKKEVVISPKRWYKEIDIDMENLLLPGWIQI